MVTLAAVAKILWLPRPQGYLILFYVLTQPLKATALRIFRDGRVGVGMWRRARESALGRAEEITLALNNRDWKLIEL